MISILILLSLMVKMGDFSEFPVLSINDTFDVRESCDVTEGSVVCTLHNISSLSRLLYGADNVTNL